MCCSASRRVFTSSGWMSSWSDRQSSIVTDSRWWGERRDERNLPPNMRVMGDSVDLD